MDLDIGQIFYLLVLLAFFLFCIWVVKRRWIDKKEVSASSQFVGENIIMNFSDAEKKKAMQEIVYQRDEKEEKDDSGDDLSRFFDYEDREKK
ncbi:MAG: hypothetical protein GY863_21185 [bacterium]|nr:hypothetical protein [bacterium]